ncbi:hypothetical protein [Pseudoalteromonas sp. OOF1S-7]|uniref:3-hydroxyacyl-ACP dehydratase FabZ family protein n=1 Tax=Pseudoalteromonas sp. OOF1S-7 TaxID=2917757 RepID=UPI001EF60864|nr:hypothetical protein [Pseudoalteromonas sp. OOF1S-7]MCG7536686.1 hypothetical protein [Pseudoalteromonas sp. OOF1S-7]
MEKDFISGERITQYLPQRFPFLLLDQITSFEKNEWAKGCKVIAAKEPFLLQDTEQNWPSELVIESLGQLTIALINVSNDADKAPQILLGSISGVTQHAPIPLACRLDMSVRLEVLSEDSFVTSGFAEVDGTRVLTMDSLVAKIIKE